jgi:hypothetical protein
MTRPAAHTLPEHLTDLLRSIEAFLADTLCKEEIDDQDYVPGSGRIEFHARHLRNQRQLPIEEHRPSAEGVRANEFEEALFERLLQPRDFNLLVLLGGLGAGKTTTVKFLHRRFRERRDQLRQGFHCPCPACHRDPIYLDFRALGEKRALRAESVVPEVFREIRLHTYHRIISEWLHRIGIQPSRIVALDPEFLVLRRLLIANDLLRFHGAEHSGLTGLAAADLTLDYSLTQSRPKEEEIVALIQHHRRAALAYEGQLRNVAEDPNHSQDLMVVTLQFFLYRCNPGNPMNLIIIDNLDQLPTAKIEDLLSELHDVATRTSGLPLLLPLRPSSINPYGFVREMVFRYHYGPNNFEMILSRLQRYILARSREELKRPRSLHPDSPFHHSPSDAEVDILLIVSYLYARIMVNGVRGARSQEVAILRHEEHAFLDQITIGRGALLSLAETVDALVGACCRYAFDVLKRYFFNCYGNPVLIRRLAAAHIAGEVGPSVRIQYADLVACLLRDPIGGGRVSRVANLFSPTRVGSHPGWPSLVKLRILGLLSRDQRKQVGAIVQRLASFGVPAELTIEALNSLQDKFRLLLWFSTNRQLDPRDDKSLEEDVVISEHGERYFRRVIGDFEYVWYCATSLQERQYTPGGLKFTMKLDDYRRLIRQVGLTEWKQICFERFRAGSLADIGGVGSATSMSVLTVLYSSLARVLLSTGIAMRVHGQRAKLSTELSPLLEAICQELLFWQDNYEVGYDSNYYLFVYEEELKELVASVAETGDEKHVSSELKDSLGRLHESWTRAPKSRNSLRLQAVTYGPAEEVATVLARHGSGLVPGIEAWAKSTDMNRRSAVFLARFLETRSHLATVLSSGLPTYSEIFRAVSHLLGDIQAVVVSAGEVGATGEALLRWCVDERAVLLRTSETLKANRYDVPPVCTCDAMSDCKNRFNNIAEATEQLARHCAVSETWHLSHRWQ